MTTTHRLTAKRLTLRYDQKIVARELSVAIPDDRFTVIIGPNACGKSTLLRALGGVLQPAEGVVLLDGSPLPDLAAKQRARVLALLPQTMTAPEGITVRELVHRGRFAHQRVLRRHSAEDARAVDTALHETHVTDLGDRRLDELSGGQRQRVWIAMTLAQDTPLVLLDEPTTFLDLPHQIDVLDVLHRLARGGRTVVAVLHDLNLAARYADHVVAMRDGALVAEGPPEKVVTVALLRDVFGLDAIVVPDPLTGSPMVVPADSRMRSAMD